MSWIFGYFGNRERHQIDSPETPIHSYQSYNLILYTGGNNKTIFHKSDTLNSSCWAAAGVGLKQSGNGYINLNTSGWNNYLSPREVDLSEVNGHYVALKYADDELKFFADELGLREIFLVKLSGGWGFTTRIDWLKRFIDPDFGLQEFGARWLLQNQISRGSIIKNVKRLVCASATIKNNILKVEENPWQPDFEVEGGKEKFESTLKQLLSIGKKKTSLSLSGGLDSRLLLSYLLNKYSEQWETHTFGDPNHPDSKIASELLKSVNLENIIINEAIPSKEKAIELLRNFALQSVVTSRISSILNLRFYDLIAAENKVIVDGGFGEMWRREFANKFLLLGKKALLAKDVEKTFRLFSDSKPDLFSEDAIKEMRVGSVSQIENIFSELPDANEINLENWLDIFTIRARLINTSAPEQARVDNYAVSFMPFIQKDILKILFSFSVKERKNGKLFKDIIRRNATALTRIPLVKGNITYPFGASSLSARVYSKFKKKTGLSYKGKRIDEILTFLRDFILDLLNSSRVRNYELYDRRKIERLAKGFSSNSAEFNSEIDWFLSFELFRQGISK
ncbi:MAG: hypothetical protein OQK64_11115 [Ignavibacteriaceae bacterium]|nr:hypothetical protein [Ignavibacteriaceae bacterium]